MGVSVNTRRGGWPDPVIGWSVRAVRGLNWGPFVGGFLVDCLGGFFVPSVYEIRSRVSWALTIMKLALRFVTAGLLLCRGAWEISSPAIAAGVFMTSNGNSFM